MAIVEDVSDEDAPFSRPKPQLSARTAPSDVSTTSNTPLVPSIPGNPTKPAEEDDHELSAWWDEVFDAVTLTIPFSFLYLLLDILVYFQYQHRPTFRILAEHMFRAVPTLGFIVFYTTRHATHPLTNPVLMSASVLTGSRLIWLMNKASWSVVTAQAPSMGTLWVLTIVQLPLSRAVLSLLGVAGWCYHSGLKVMP